MLPNERCSATGNCGAGATTLVWPMFKSPHLRVEADSTLGGGSTMAGCGACKFCARAVTLTSGGGATTDVGSSGNFTFLASVEVAASGTAGCAPGQATMLGSGMSRFSLRLGGVTIVWVLLSGSGGTEMIGSLRELVVLYAGIDWRQVFRR